MGSVLTKAGFGAAFALLLGVGIAAVIHTYAWETSVAWVTHTYDLMGRLEDLARDSRELDSAARLLSVNFTSQGTEQLREHLSRIVAETSEIHRLTTDNPREEKQSLRLQELARVREDAMAAAMATGNGQGFAAVLAERGALTKGARVTEILSAMHAEEKRLFDIRMWRQREIAGLARRLFEVASILSFLMTLFAALRAVSDGKKRTAAEKALAAREEQYRQVVEMAGDMIFRVDCEGRFTFWNESFLSMLHFTEREVIARSYLKLVRHDKRREVQRFYLRQFARHRQTTYLEFPAIDGHGRERWVGQNVQLLERDGKVIGFQGIARDITERKRAEFELQKSRGFVERIAATTPGILYVFDLEERRTIYCNRELTAVLGYQTEEMDRYLNEGAKHFHPDDAPLIRKHRDCLRNALDGEVRRIEYRAMHADGQWVWLATRDTPFERNAQGMVTRIVGIAQDVTARKATQEKLAYQANYDALTGLANRRHFTLKLNGVLRRAAMEHVPAALCMLDVDRFREVNERYGRAAGDEVLEAIGHIMRGELRSRDLAGRIDGDQFVFVLPETEREEAVRVAERIRGRLAERTFGTTTPFKVTAAFGVVEWTPGSDAAQMVEAVDRALYRARSEGRNLAVAI